MTVQFAAALAVPNANTRIMTERLTTFVALLVLPLLVFAATQTPPPPLAAKPPEPPQIDATAYILMDYNSGMILAGKDIDQKVPPASLTKVMTSYVAAGEIGSGRIHLNDDVPISVNAWRHADPKRQESAMFVREGTTVKLEDLLRGVIIQSGNDATVAVAEYVGGSEDAFVELMNQHASKIGIA